MSDGGSSRTLLKGAGLLSVAVAGGAVALLGAWLFGGFGEGTTTVREMLAEAPTPPPASVAATDGMTIGQIYGRDAPGVVQITAKIYTQARDPIFGTPYGFATEEKALGSGFVLSKEGYILTSYHVVHGASEIHVSFSNNDSLNARIVGSDATTDVAVLKVSAKSRAFKPLQLGNSDSVRIGDSVVALGNPVGYTRTVTAGIVSALQRRIQSPNSQTIDHIIQTDAAINPGNSGGPLLDAVGRVIGINSQIATGDGSAGGGGGNVGIGFAVPINTAKKVLPQLKQNGRVQRAYLGITGVTIDKSLDRLNLASQSGVLVQSVSPGSPADKAGIRGGSAQTTLDGSDVQLGGDVITKIDGKSVGSMDDVISAIADKKPGDSVRLQYLRNKTSKSATVTLTQRPATVPQQ